jgi:epsilon-lactone hydrolase
MILPEKIGVIVIDVYNCCIHHSKRGKFLTMNSQYEQQVRMILPLVRFMQHRVPLGISTKLLKNSLARLKLGPHISREALQVNGVSCQRLVPQNGRTNRVLLYFHGGGFVFGLSAMHVKLGAYLAQKMNTCVLMVDYRLAPKYPFPAALDDCLNTYRWLLDQGIPAQEIVLAGDSAGGNLAIASVMSLRDEGSPLPAAAACLSPAVDLVTKTGDQDQINDPLLSPQAIKFYSKSYTGTEDAKNPLISPVYGDLTGLPPFLVHVGEDEMLCPDAVRLVDLARACGVNARLEVYPGMWHVWQLFMELPQAVKSLDEVADFLVSHLE